MFGCIFKAWCDIKDALVWQDIPFRYIEEIGFVQTDSYRYAIIAYNMISVTNHGTTVTPIDFACAMTVLQSPSSGSPDSLNSVCFIFAMS